MVISTIKSTHQIESEDLTAATKAFYANGGEAEKVATDTPLEVMIKIVRNSTWRSPIEKDNKIKSLRESNKYA
jgi:hypothetical protein